MKGSIRGFLDAGVTLTFTSFVEVWKKGWPFDRRVARVVVTKRAAYDLWNETYRLEVDGRPLWIADLASLQKELQTIRVPSVLPLDRIDPAGVYFSP